MKRLLFLLIFPSIAFANPGTVMMAGKYTAPGSAYVFDWDAESTTVQTPAGTMSTGGTVSFDPAAKVAPTGTNGIKCDAGYAYISAPAGLSLAKGQAVFYADFRTVQSLKGIMAFTNAGGTDTVYIWIYDGNMIAVNYTANSTTKYANSGAIIANDTDYKINVLWGDSSNGSVLKIYVDGVDVTQDGGGSFGTVASDVPVNLYWGSDATGGNAITAHFDLMRIYDDIATVY